MTGRDFIKSATAALHDAGVTSARLDTLVLLGDELQRDKAWLLAHDDAYLTEQQVANLTDKLTRRIRREPLAYIRGYQEFYGREFMVTPDVLIPRPETEAIIEMLTQLPQASGITLADIGTGSGTIAITAKLEHPGWKVVATDLSPKALAIARQNAERLKAVISFEVGNLLEPLRQPIDILVANLPYVDPAWERDSPETDSEPAIALFAEDNGLELIYTLLKQSPSHLRGDGYVLLEADPQQHPAIIRRAAEYGYKLAKAKDYCLCFKKSARNQLTDINFQDMAQA